MADYILDHGRADRTYYYNPGVVVARIINTIIGIIEATLVLALVLKLFGANAQAPIIAWVYNLSDRLVGPFAGAFPALGVQGGTVIDFSIILAMVGYAIIGWILTWLLSLAITPRV
jgi:uncharacterized protein YggT (Ycf19 family)